MEIKSISNAQHYIWAEICDGWHLVKSENLSVIQERVPPGGEEILHCHQFAEQFFFVLSGKATIEVNEQIFIVSPHEGLHVKAGVWHKLSNKHIEDLSFLVISTPPSHGDRILTQGT